MEPTLVVIGAEPCETSRGPIAAGQSLRLPVVEAIQLSHAQKVTLADWHVQQAPDVPPSVVDRVLSAVETVVDTIKPSRRRYKRRDMRAEK